MQTNLIKQAVNQAIAEALGIVVETEKESAHPAIGKKCIVRTYASGVLFGTVTAVSNNDGRSRATIKNARRLWRWFGGISLSEISQTGIDQSKSRISTTVPEQYIEDCIEFIPASEKAIKSIEGAKDDDAGK
jgi:hypothetical protein